MHEDLIPHEFNEKRGIDAREPSETTKFERQVADPFRALGFIDVQRGFNSNAGGAIDAAGPHSRIIIECKAATDGVASSALNAAIGAWVGCPDLDESWRKCFVSRGGFAGFNSNAGSVIGEESDDEVLPPLAPVATSPQSHTEPAQPPPLPVTGGAIDEEPDNEVLPPLAPVASSPQSH